MTRKRLIPLALILVGLVLIAAGLVYWRFLAAVDNPDEAPLPEMVAGLALSRASYGKEAKAEEARPHCNSQCWSRSIATS
jgi:hypothetical protein